MTRVRLQPGNNYSEGLAALSRSSGIRRLRRSNSRFRPRSTDLIINWGNPTVKLLNAQYLNTPEAVAVASDKIESFQQLDNLCPEWAVDKDKATLWLQQGHRVISRALTRGSQGRGTTVYSFDGTDYSQDYESFLEARTVPLYVKVFGTVPSRVSEYRVHVFDHAIIDVQMKRKRRDYDGDFCPYIRSARNGWVFCREDLGDYVPQTAHAIDVAAFDAVSCLRLNFGAVDIAVDETTGNVCVYEVNTAPGLEGTTLESYSRALNNYVQERNLST